MAIQRSASSPRGQRSLQEDRRRPEYIRIIRCTARPGASVTYCSQQRRPGRVPRYIGAYHHRQYTVPLCLGVSEGPRHRGIV